MKYASAFIAAAITVAVWGAALALGGVPAQHIAAMPQPEGTRAALIAYALSLQGTPYIGGEYISASYRAGMTAEGGDCSATMQHIYAHVAGINITESTFSQWPALRPIDASEVEPGDLWYGVFPKDEHVGMLADVDGDGRWDLIHNGADASYLHVTYDFQNSYLAQHTKGYRRAL